jgi:hypothetical protein
MAWVSAKLIIEIWTRASGAANIHRQGLRWLFEKLILKNVS